MALELLTKSMYLWKDTNTRTHAPKWVRMVRVKCKERVENRKTHTHTYVDNIISLGCICETKCQT